MYVLITSLVLIKKCVWFVQESRSASRSVSPRGSGKSGSQSPAQSPAHSKGGSHCSRSKSRSRSRSKSWWVIHWHKILYYRSTDSIWPLSCYTHPVQGFTARESWVQTQIGDFSVELTSSVSLAIDKSCKSSRVSLPSCWKKTQTNKQKKKKRHLHLHCLPISASCVNECPGHCATNAVTMSVDRTMQVKFTLSVQIFSGELNVAALDGWQQTLFS